MRDLVTEILTGKGTKTVEDNYSEESRDFGHYTFPPISDEEWYSKKKEELLEFLKGRRKRTHKRGRPRKETK